MAGSTARRVARSALLALAFVSGCDAGTAVPATADIGGPWTVVEVGEYRPDPLDAPRIQFTVARGVTGTTGCNDVYAEMRIDGARIVLEHLAATAKGCRTARLRDIETAFVAALEGAEQLQGSTESGRLVITGLGSDIVLSQPTR